VLGPNENPYNGNSYMVIPAAGITWDDANEAAMKYGKGWHLATVCDERENEFINKLRMDAQLGQVWLGGYQDPLGETVPSAGWTWVNDEGPINTSFWLPNEPNDNYGPASEQYLAMGLTGTSGWNDEGNLGNIAGYVIEKGPSHCASVPEGGAGLALLGGSLLGLAGLRRRFTKTA
jgi:hypothetical protein